MTKVSLYRRIQSNLAWQPREVGPPSLTAEECWSALLRLWPQPEDSFVQGLFHLLLHRPVDPSEYQACLSQLRQGRSRVELVRFLASTEDYARLGRPASWLERLSRFTSEGCRAELLRLWQETDETFLRGIHELLQHRPPDEREQAAGLSQLRGDSGRFDLVRSLAESAEARRYGFDPTWLDDLEIRVSEQTWGRLKDLWQAGNLDFVQGLYQVLLCRGFDLAHGLRHVAALESGTERVDLVKAVTTTEPGWRSCAGWSWLAWLDSGAGRRSLSDRSSRRKQDRRIVRRLLQRLEGIPDLEVFVRRAYEVILGRAPSAAELEKQVGRLRRLPLYTRRLFLGRLLRYRNN